MPQRLFAAPLWPWLAVLAGAFTLLTLVTLPIGFQAQAMVAYTLLASLLVLRLFRQSRVARLTLFILAAFVAARYFYWRTTETIGWHGAADFSVALALYAAEVYGLIIFLLGMFTNANPVQRTPQPLAGEPAHYPTVDVLIPTYNEAPEILEVTLIAATQMRYPAERVKVWLCDDGGTEQRLAHPDRALAEASRERRATLMAMCERLDAHYLTRERNEGSKAGNLNAAMARTDGELIVVLDADHIPTADFLEQTVGFMQADPRLFLVQTPHFFVNPDPFEKNHQLFGRIPSENEMFYQVIQPGLDFWNSAFFCGSAALLRRKPLEEAGGVAGLSITEDAETALKLHGMGYRSVYLNRPLISGLQPETYSAFMVQRVRWAQGMVQIFLLKNPLLQPGLAWYQRLNYFSSSFFWFFGFARITYLLAPVAYLVFGLKIYDANLQSFLTFAVPYLLASVVLSEYLFGRVRWPFVSEVYELLQSLYTLPAIARVFLNPKAPSFAVTPKGETSDRDFISQLAGPFYVFYAITVFALCCGVARWVMFPADRSLTGITLGWELLNMLILQAAHGVLFERRQLRSAPRMPANLQAELRLGASPETPGIVRDMSVGGAQMAAGPEALTGLARNAAIELRIPDAAAGCTRTLRGHLAWGARRADGGVGFGVRFQVDSVEEKRAIVSLVHGDSARWQAFQAGRRKRLGILRGFLFLLGLGLRGNGDRCRILAEALARPFNRKNRAAAPEAAEAAVAQAAEAAVAAPSLTIQFAPMSSNVPDRGGLV